MYQSAIHEYFSPIEKTGFLKIVSRPHIDKTKQTLIDNYFPKGNKPT